VAFFHPNSQACESCLVTSASDVFMGATKQPVTLCQTVPSNTCAGRSSFQAVFEDRWQHAWEAAQCRRRKLQLDVELHAQNQHRRQFIL